MLRAREASIRGSRKEPVVAVRRGTRMIMTIPRDHIVAVIVRVVITPRRIVMMRRIRMMIIGPRMVVLRSRGSWRDEGESDDSRRC